MKDSTMNINPGGKYQFEFLNPRGVFLACFTEKVLSLGTSICIITNKNTWYLIVLCQINLVTTDVPLLYLLKPQDSVWFSGVSRLYKMGTLISNGLRENHLTCIYKCRYRTLRTIYSIKSMTRTPKILNTMASTIKPFEVPLLSSCLLLFGSPSLKNNINEKIYLICFVFLQNKEKINKST